MAFPGTAATRLAGAGGLSAGGDAGWVIVGIAGATCSRACGVSASPPLLKPTACAAPHCGVQTGDQSWCSCTVVRAGLWCGRRRRPPRPRRTLSGRRGDAPAPAPRRGERLNEPQNAALAPRRFLMTLITRSAPSRRSSPSSGSTGWSPAWLRSACGSWASGWRSGQRRRGRGRARRRASSRRSRAWRRAARWRGGRAACCGRSCGAQRHGPGDVRGRGRRRAARGGRREPRAGVSRAAPGSGADLTPRIGGSGQCPRKAQARPTEGDRGNAWGMPTEVN